LDDGPLVFPFVVFFAAGLCCELHIVKCSYTAI